MARYGKTTSLAPQRVLELARERFGPEGEIGLAISAASPNEVVFEGGGGGIVVTAVPLAADLKATEVEILSREYDYWAERFLPDLPNA